MISTGVLETCSELEYIYIYEKRIVRQVGYLQVLLPVDVSICMIHILFMVYENLQAS
jgi:hypothetical protein